MGGGWRHLTTVGVVMTRLSNVEYFAVERLGHDLPFDAGGDCRDVARTRNEGELSQFTAEG